MAPGPYQSPVIIPLTHEIVKSFQIPLKEAYLLRHFFTPPACLILTWTGGLCSRPKPVAIFELSASSGAPWGRESPKLIVSTQRIQVSPTFHKFTLPLFALMKDLHQYLLLLSERHPKRIYTFTLKGEEWKQRSAFVWQPDITEAACTSSSESGPPNSFPQNYIQHPSIKPP